MRNRWIETTLDDVCIRITDGAHASPKSVDHGLPMASVKDLSPHGINLTTCRHISHQDFERLVRYGCQPQVGDVLVAKDGATALDTVCEIRTPLEVVLLSSVAILRPDPEKVTPSFLRYYMDCDTTRRYLKGGFVTGAAIPRVILLDFKRCRIIYPQLSTQRKITSVLSAYDDLIENNTRRIAILEEMAWRIYEEWFVYFRFPGHEKMKMVESSLGMIPRGWEVKRLKEICERVDYGYTASAKNEKIGPKFLRITDIVPSVINWPRVPFCEIDNINLRKYLLAPGDIVIARTGATTGYAKRINKLHPEAVFASYLVRLRVQNYFSNLLVGIIVESDEYKQFIKANLGGAAQPQANAQVLASRLIVVPPQQLQQEFDKIVEPLIDQKEVLALKNENLRSSRDLLLPKLISGEIDVSHFPAP